MENLALTGVKTSKKKMTVKAEKQDNSDDNSGANLDRINLETDERVFLLLDEGCNRTCHTPAFAKHPL